MRYFFIIIFSLGVAFGLNGFLPITPYEPGDTAIRPHPDFASRYDDSMTAPPIDPKSIRDAESSFRPGDFDIGRGDLGTPGRGKLVSIDAYDSGV